MEGERMIDIHSHLIFGVDDGSNCLEESVRMIEKAKMQNINTIIATPHFQKGIFNGDGVEDKFRILAERAAEYSMDIRLGKEMFADEWVINIINHQRYSTTGGLPYIPYILVELPYNASFSYVASFISRVTKVNIDIIIAHPERNRRIMKNFNEFISLVRATNCRIQVDAGSIAGVYGVFVKEIARQMLKMKAVDFVASNAHTPDDYTSIFSAAAQKIYRLCGEEYAIRLLELNAREIINLTGRVNHYGREIS